MERAEGNREMFSLSIGSNGIRSDLVQKLMKHSRNHEREEGDEELELSLGLSMNGRFGVDPARKRLKRSSSISNLVFAVGAADNGSCSHQAREVEEFDTYALSRTRSLPTEVEEEWRRRKEFQSMRRMEARKKRMEKLRNVRVQKDKENCCENGNGFHETVNKNSIDNGIINKFENGNEISVMDCGRVKKKEEEEKLEKWSRMPIWGREWDQKGRKEDAFGPQIIMIWAGWSLAVGPFVV